MELFQKKKIELYAEKDFSRKLNDTFGLLRDNWRVLLRYETYIMLPICVLLAFFMNRFMVNYMGLIQSLEVNQGLGITSYSFVINLLGSLLLSATAYVALMGLVYSLFSFYFFSNTDLSAITWEELKPRFFHSMGRAAVLMFAFLGIFIGVMIVIVSIAALMFAVAGANFLVVAFLLYLLLIVAAVVLGVPLSLAMPIYMFEDDVTVVEAMKKAFHLGFPTWGGIFAVTFVISLISSVLQSFTTMPWYVMILVKTFFTIVNEGNAGFFDSFIYDIIQYLMTILMCFGYMIAMTIELAGLVILYGHASEKIDGRGVSQDIEQFDQFDNF